MNWAGSGKWRIRWESVSESCIICGWVVCEWVDSDWGIWNEVKGRRWVGFEVDWSGVLNGVGLETEGVTGIWGNGGRVIVNETVDTGESVSMKVLFGLFADSSKGADGEKFESSLI